MLGDTDAENGHQHRAEGRELGEVGDGAFEDQSQPLGADEIDGVDLLAAHRMAGVKTRKGGGRRQHQHDAAQPDEQQGGVGQPIADGFDAIEGAVRQGGYRHGGAASGLLTGRITTAPVSL